MSKVQNNACNQTTTVNGTRLNRLTGTHGASGGDDRVLRLNPLSPFRPNANRASMRMHWTKRTKQTRQGRWRRRPGSPVQPPFPLQLWARFRVLRLSDPYKIERPRQNKGIRTTVHPQTGTRRAAQSLKDALSRIVPLERASHVGTCNHSAAQYTPRCVALRRSQMASRQL